ncbi:MAG: T9SS type A sorting domain-containing protein [Dysgonamonadaceae bacterium]|jgi:hypothetical protein|nr:T9SS type A sorting domain-containing protein [Dysgonamonadaceae bacterium]
MKNLKFYSALIVICSFVRIDSFAQTYGGGDGSQNLPYLISTKLDMVALANAVNNGNNYSGKYFLLTQDLVGTDNIVTTTVGFLNSFNGMFDGGGYEIEVNDSPGVFGTLSSATIKNLGVRGNVNTDLSTSNGAGGTCAYASNSTFINCWNRSTVSSKISGGGICGRASNCSFTDCYNLGSVTVSSTGNRAGGICGSADGCNISKCYNQGNISASTTTTSNTGNFPMSGGISGYYGTISNCYNTGNISAYIYEGSYATSFNYSPRAGGICGYGGTVQYCYNTGNITADSRVSTSSTYSYAGGICGEGFSIKNCMAANTTITSRYIIKNGTITYNNDGPAGRIDGRGTGTITNCYALSSMSLISSSTVTSNVNGQHGGSEVISSFQSQDWIVAYLFWDFDQIWKMPESGLPILKKTSEINFYISLPVTYGDMITLNATGSNSAFPILYKSSNSEIAEIEGNTLVARKAGSVKITAYQEADDDFDGGFCDLNITIEKATLTIRVQNEQREKGTENPSFILLYESFKYDDNEESLEQLPQVFCDADTSSPTGFYDIVLSGGFDKNYSYQLIDGKLEIIDNVSEYIKKLEEENADLKEQILLLQNLLEECENNSATSVSGLQTSPVFLYPNPTTGMVYFDNNQNIDVFLFNVSGKELLHTQANSIDLSSYSQGIYLIKIGDMTRTIIKQ